MLGRDPGALVRAGHHLERSAVARIQPLRMGFSQLAAIERQQLAVIAAKIDRDDPLASPQLPLKRPDRLPSPIRAIDPQLLADLRRGYTGGRAPWRRLRVAADLRPTTDRGR